MKLKNGRLKSRWYMLLFICGLTGLMALPLITGYSRAVIASQAQVRISDTRDALIAIYMPPDVVCFPGDQVVLARAIKNNMNAAVELHSCGMVFSPLLVAAGASSDLEFSAGSHMENKTGHIQACWAAGKALIPYTIAIEVIDTDLLGAEWDVGSQRGTISNQTGHHLAVEVNGQELDISDTGFEREGDYAHITFYTPDRKYSHSLEPLSTPEPPLDTENVAGESDEPDLGLARERDPTNDASDDANDDAKTEAIQAPFKTTPTTDKPDPQEATSEEDR